MGISSHKEKGENRMEKGEGRHEIVWFLPSRTKLTIQNSPGAAMSRWNLMLEHDGKVVAMELRDVDESHLGGMRTNNYAGGCGAGNQERSCICIIR